jgi:hypothetical protein
LNPSRLRKRNAKFMTALWHGQKLQQQAAQPAKKPEPAGPEEGLSIYDRVAALEKQLDLERANCTREEWDAYHAKTAAENLARAAEELKRKLVGKTCRGCARPAELLVGLDFYCNACREIPKPKPEPAEVKPARAEQPKPAPVQPPEERQIGAATRTAITTALVPEMWRGIHASVPRCGGCGADLNRCICNRIEQFAL